MARTELILTFMDQSAHRRRIVTRSTRITLGRDPGNDVAIDDSNLSRHHAVIENVDKSIQVSDCNSRNGTSVNGHPVVGPVQLFDGDVINLAGSCDIAVAFQRASTSTVPFRFSVPAISGAAVALILLIAGVLLGVYALNGPEKSSANTNITTEPRKDDHEVTGPTPSTPKQDPTPHDVLTESLENSTEQVARAVKRVMSKLSNDNAPYISDAGLNDVKQMVEQYRGSTDLKEKLRAAKIGCPEITVQAQSINVRPALVMYAALADSETNPVASAKKMIPRLLTLRATFGTETANSSLLLVAAYPYPFNPPIGSQTRTPHPLASKLVEFGGRRSTVETSEARSVWFLREKNGITNEAYDLVIRLLAIGVIAQNPSQFGIEADPPLC
jgi:FHA domain